MISPESPATDEASLLAEAGRGSEDAFLALYERFSAPLYSLLFKMLQNRQDAEESLQAAFVQIWKKAATYDEERCGVFTWLVLITRSKGIDRLRQRQRQSRLLDAVTREDLASSGMAGSEQSAVVEHENAGAVRAALEQIPAEQRQAIEMAFFKGMSQSEISEALAEPLGTVKARIRRGMLRLRDYLVRRL